MSKYNPEIVVKWFAEHGLKATSEFQFDPARKWRFDFVISHAGTMWPVGMQTVEGVVALEVEGGVWTGGRHTRGSGFVKDMAKYNRAACLGWRILRTTPDELCMQETVDMVKEALGR